MTGVTGETGRYSARDVVVAAGAWSGLLEGLPRPLPVEPVRGQMAALPWPADVPRAIVYHKDCYILARGGEAIIGSTMESRRASGRRSRLPDWPRSSRPRCCCLPACIRAKVRRTWAGLRPMTPDGLPIIGGEPTAQRALVRHRTWAERDPAGGDYRCARSPAGEWRGTGRRLAGICCRSILRVHIATARFHYPTT